MYLHYRFLVQLDSQRFTDLVCMVPFILVHAHPPRARILPEAVRRHID